MAITDRVKQAWNAFRNRPMYEPTQSIGPSSFYRPDRNTLTVFHERTTITSIYNKLSVDFADVEYSHIDTDNQGRFKKIRFSNLHYALTLEPNIDQGPRALRQDIATTMLDKGCAVIVPVDTSVDPNSAASYEIYTLRVGHPVEWFPEHVRVSLFNEKRQERQEILVEKARCAIVENPFYSVMNAPNSTLLRLQQKLALLDRSDHRASSGRLDVIIQLPYTIKSEARREEAEKRLKSVEVQLQESSHGIAYLDATEKITQLNRPAENQLLKQIEYLTGQLYTQLGLTPEIMNGTATDEAMLNYYARTIEPMVLATVEAMQRAFIGRNRTTRGERIDFFRDPFKLVPMKDMAEMADKFTRNEVLSSNEIRGLMRFRPSDDPKADQLVNSNMPGESGAAAPAESSGGIPLAEVESLMDEFVKGVTKDIESMGGADGSG